MSDFLVTATGTSEVKNIKDIRGYEKLLSVDPNRQSLACKVLRRVIKSLDNGVSTLKVQYSSDPKAIKKFMKKKQAYNSRRVVQRQKQQVSLSELSRIHLETIQDDNGQQLQNISSIIHIEQDVTYETADVQMIEDNSTIVNIDQPLVVSGTVIKIPVYNE